MDNEHYTGEAISAGRGQIQNESKIKGIQKTLKEEPQKKNSNKLFLRINNIFKLHIRKKPGWEIPKFTT